MGGIPVEDDAFAMAILLLECERSGRSFQTEPPHDGVLLNNGLPEGSRIARGAIGRQRKNPNRLVPHPMARVQSAFSNVSLQLFERRRRDASWIDHIGQRSIAKGA